MKVLDHKATVGFTAKSGRMYCGVCGVKVVQTATYYRDGKVVHAVRGER